MQIKQKGCWRLGCGKKIAIFHRKLFVYVI